MGHDKYLSETYRRNIEQSKIEHLIDELNTGTLNRKAYNDKLSFNVRVQIKDRSLEVAQEELVNLFSLLTDEEIKEKSLELQMWYRDYNEIEQAKQDALEKESLRQLYRESGLAKLTPEEIEALNIKL